MASNSEQSTDTYSTDPNQIVYDQAHQVDFEVEVLSVYFAEQKPNMIWEAKSEKYTVKSGGNPASVKVKFTKKDRRKIVADLADNVALKAGQVVTISWEEEVQAKDATGKPKFDYVKLDKAKIKDKIFVVANCNGTNGKLSIEINENKLTNEVLVYTNPVKFLIGEVEKTKIEFTVNNTFVYAQEITLRPKTDEDLKTLIDKFDKRKNKNAFLYFKAQVTDTKDEVKYADNSQEFLNKNNSQFEILGTPCYCNRDITVDEMIDLIYHLREKQSYVSKREHFFNSGGEKIDAITISSGKISDNRAKIKLFVTEMNTMFTKFGIKLISFGVQRLIL